MDTKENIQVDELVKDGTKEIKIIHVKGLDEKDYRAIVEEGGNIKSAGNYCEVRGLKDNKDCVVRFSRDKMYINLIEDPRDQRSAKVNGSLLINPDLAEFGINDKEFYTPKELSEFINMRRHLFHDRSEVMGIVNALRNFKGKVDVILEKSDDTKGNMRSLIEKKSEFNFPDTLRLNMPLFVGYPAKMFDVEVCLDFTGNGIQIWLESAQLNEMIKTDRDIIIDQELERFGNVVFIES